MKRQTRMEKERQIRERYRFISEGKDDAMRTLISLGRKMGKLRYLMIVVLFVFLFVYHASYHLFLQLKMREKMARVVAYIMVVAVLISSVNLTTFAMNQIIGDEGIESSNLGNEPQSGALEDEDSEDDNPEVEKQEDEKQEDDNLEDGDLENVDLEEGASEENPEENLAGDEEDILGEPVMLMSDYGIQTYSTRTGYQTLTISSSSLNGNAVLGKEENLSDSIRLDNAAAFYVKNPSRNSGIGGFPESGSITIGGVPYQCGWTGSSAYDGYDCIRLVGSGSQTMQLSTYGAYETIYVLGTAGGPGTGNYAGFSVTLNYTDGTSASTSYNMYDWYDTTAVPNVTKQGGWYRIESNGSYTSLDSGGKPVLQSAKITADPKRLLKSITFTLNGCYSSSGAAQTSTVYCGVFAVTGAVSANAPATPTLSSATDVISNAFTANWNSISNATGYYIDVATDESFSNMVSGYNNMSVGNATSYRVSGLTTGQTYYYRVRSYNNYGSSLSSSSCSVTPKFIPLEKAAITYQEATESEKQRFTWSPVSHAGKYDWSLKKDGIAVADNTIIVTEDIKNNDVSFDFAQYLDGAGTYELTVTAKPSDSEIAIYSNSENNKTVTIALPEITCSNVNLPSGSGIGGNVSVSMTDGLVTLNAVPMNSYSDFYGWNTPGEDAVEQRQLQIKAAVSYDAITAYFGVYKPKITSSYDPSTEKYTLTLQDDLALEGDLQFGDDVVIDLNNRTLTTDDDKSLIVDNSILKIKNGNVESAATSDKNALSTVGNGAIIIESSVDMAGAVGGDAETVWTEEDGSIHYATLADALTDEEKKAENGSNLTLIQDITITENLTISEAVKVTVPSAVTLSVIDGKTLTNEGTLDSDGTIENSGTIKNTGNWKNAGDVMNTGTIQSDGILDNNAGSIDNNGTISGSGEISNENGTIDTMDGSVENPVDNGYKGEVKSQTTWSEDNKQYFGSLEDAVANAESKPEQNITITLQDDMELKTDITVPENTTLFVPTDVTLTIPEDTTLKNEGSIVESGTLDIRGKLGTQAGWSEGSTNYYGTLDEALEEVKDGETITLMQNTVWDSGEPLQVPENVILQVPEDIVLILPEETEIENEENIVSESTWGNSAGTNYGSLKEAVSDATDSSENVKITIRDDVTLEEDLALPSNVVLEIPSDKSLTVPENTELTNNGSIEASGDLHVDGTFKTEAGWSDDTTDYYGSFDKAMDAVNDDSSNVTDVTILGAVILDENTTIPEGVTIEIDPKGSLTISEDTTLTNQGSLNNDGTITNNGTVKNDSEMVNTGTVDGAGSISNENGSIDTDEGVIQNKVVNENGVEDNSKVSSEAGWTKDDVTYYGALSKVLSEAENGATVTVYKDLIISENMFVKPGVTLEIEEDVEITINSQTTLTNNGAIKNAGTIKNNGTIDGTGSITNKGVIDSSDGNIQNDISNEEGGKVTSPVSWTKDGVTYYGTLEGALANTTSGDKISLLDNVELTADTEIPEGVTLVIPEGKTLNIPKEKTLVNKGTIKNLGSLVNSGVLDTSDGVVTNAIITNPGGTIKSEALWTIDGVTYHGSLNKAMEMAAEHSPAQITIQPEENPMIIKENVTIPENATLDIPSDASIIVTKDVVITNNGRITNQGKLSNLGKIDGEGTVSNENGGIIDSTKGTISVPVTSDEQSTIKTEVKWVDSDGKTHYGSLKEGLEAVKDASRKVTVNTPELEIQGTVTIPEGVTLEIPEDTSVTVTDGAKLINNGNILAEGDLSTKGSGILEAEVSWIDSTGITHYGTLEEALEALNLSDGTTINVTKITILGEDVSLPENTITIPDGVELEIAKNAKLTIPSGSSLVNEGTVSNKGDITNEGNITNTGDMSNSGLVSGGGQLNTANGKFDSENGIIENTIINGEEETVSGTVKWVTSDGKTYYGDLEAVLKNARSGDVITLLGNEEISRNVTVPEGVTLVIPEEVTLTVQEGKQLLNQGTISNVKELVNNGGTVVNQGIISGEGTISNKNKGHLDLMGGVTSNCITTDSGSTTKSEATWEIDRVTYHGALKEALKEASKAENQNKSILIRLEGKPVIVDEEVTIPANVTLDIPNSASFKITENGSVTNNGVIKNSGTVTNNGTIAGTGSIENKSGGYIDTTNGTNSNPISSAQDSIVVSEAKWVINNQEYYGSLTDGLAAGGGNVTLNTDSVTITQNITVPEDVILVIPKDSTLTVPKGVTLKNEGSIQASGKLTTQGSGKVETEAAWTDKQGIAHYGTLKEAFEELAEAVSNIDKIIVMGENVSLPDGVETVIPKNVTFEVQEGASLSIPSGKELVNNGTLANNGSISNEGTFTNNGTFHNEDGLMTGAPVNNGEKGVSTDTVKWETKDGKIYYSSLKNALENAAAEDKITLVDDIMVSGNLEIPNGVELVIPSDKTLRISNGSTVTNHGKISNNGTIDNAGTIDNEGNASIGGKNPIKNTGSGSILSDAKWEIDGKTYYGSIEDGLKALEQNGGGTLTLNKQNVTVTKDITIPSNVTLVVPKDINVTVADGVNLTNNGTIENNGTICNKGDIVGAGIISNEDGVISNNGGNIATNIDNGTSGTLATEASWTVNNKTYYGTLEDAITATKSQLNSTIKISSAVTIKKSITIPSGVKLEICRGATVTIAENVTLTNNGTLTNSGTIRCNGIFENASRVEGSGLISSETIWNDGSKTCYSTLSTAIQKASAGSTITVNSNIVLKENITIPEDVTLFVPTGKVITISSNGSITNNGTIAGGGKIQKEQSTSEGSPTDNKPSNSDKSENSSASEGSTETGSTEIDLEEEELKEDNLAKENTFVDHDAIGKSNQYENAQNVDGESPVNAENAGNADTADSIEEVEAIGALEEEATENQSSQTTEKKEVPEVSYDETQDTPVEEALMVHYGEGEVTISIETLDEQGNIDTETIGSVILSSAENVIRACLSEEELEYIKAGENIQIRLSVRTMEVTVPEEEKGIIIEEVSILQENKENLILGGYIDITLEKCFGTEEKWEKIRQLNEEIEISIDVPADMLYDNTTYYVMRLHEGETTLLDDLDDTKETITIRTGLFSTYAILYEQNEKDDWSIWIILLILLIAIVCISSIIVVKKRRSEINLK